MLLPQLNSIDEYRLSLERPETWSLAVEAICRRHRLPYSEYVPARMGTHVVFVRPDRDVIKIYSPLFPDDAARESAVLNHVQGETALETPEILFAGDLEGWPYLVMTFVSGVSLDSVWLEMEPRQRESVSASIGRILAEWHRIPIERLGMSRAAWEAFVISRSTACVGSAGSARRQAVADLNQAAIRFMDEAMQPDKTALLHGDFTGEHLLMRNTNGDWRITGLIDFGDCRIGHPEYDLVTPGLDIMIGEGKCQREMLLGYGFAPSDLTEPLREKLTRWSLLHEYIRVPEQPDGRSRLNASDEEIRSLARLLWRF